MTEGQKGVGSRIVWGGCVTNHCNQRAFHWQADKGVSGCNAIRSILSVLHTVKMANIQARCLHLVMVNIQGRCVHKLSTLWICRRGICAAEQGRGGGGVKGSDASGLRFLCTRPSGDDNSLSSLWELETISLQNKEEEEKGWLLLSLELATGQRGGLSFLQDDHLSAGGITFIGAQVFVQRMVQLPCNFQKFRYKSWFCEDVWEMFLNCSSSFGWRRSPQCGYSCGVNDIINRSILFKTVPMH